MRTFSLLCAASVLAMPVAVYAQQITSSIEGQVTNQAGAAVSGATVTITDTRTGARATVVTDSSGRFAARGLVVGGPYTVTASAQGLQGQTVEGLTTSVQGATTLTFALEPVATGEASTIVVTGTRVNAQLRAIGPGTAFGADVLANTPSFNRDVRDVIRIDPRVSIQRDEGGSNQDRVSCLGGNDRGNAFTVDGIAQADIYGLNDTGFSARSSTPIPYDAVRETQVQFAPFDVEYGQFTGCAINVITRSGSNQFHGGGFFEYSNDDLHGHRIHGFAPTGRVLPDKRWGASLGGPIIPGHLFFFGAYEHQESAQSQDLGPVGGPNPIEVPGITLAQFNQISDILRNTYHVDTGPLVTNLPFSNTRYFARVDWQINDRHRFEATYQHLEESQERQDDFFTGTSPQITGLNTYFISGSKSDYYSGRLYSNWSDRFTTEFRYSHSRIIDRQDPVGGGEAQSGNPIPRIIVGIANTSPTPNGTVLGGPGTSRSANDLRTTVDQYVALAHLDLGDHNLKFGLELNRAHVFNLFVQNATGTLIFRNVSDLQAGLLSPGTGNNQTSTLPNNVVSGATEGAFGNVSATGNINDAAAEFTRKIWSAYLQDEWQVTDQLNVVAGFRTDWFSGGHPTLNPNFVTRFGFGNATGFSNIRPIMLPRLGFTYDVNDFAVFSRTQLHGGVGIFSGGDPLVWFGNAFQNDGSTFALGTTQAAGCPAGQISVLNNGQFTGLPTCFQAAAQATAAAGQGATQAIDPNIRMPTVFRANFGFQTRLRFGSGFFDNWRLNVDYIYSHYSNPFTIVDLAQTPDLRKGLSGFTIDGRPIYTQIDPTQAGCAARLTSVGSPPVWSNVTNACYSTNANRVGEYMLTNSAGYNSQIASIILSKNFDHGIFTSGGSVFLSFGYAYSAAHDRRNLFSSTASSNYGVTAAFDRQNPAESVGFFNTRHNISISGSIRERFFGDYSTAFNFTYVGRSGRPYSLTFSGSGVFNPTQSGSNNALLYIPSGVNDPNIAPTSNAAAVQQLVDFVNGVPCARRYAGRSIVRNSCENNWFNDLDLSFSQELPGPGRLFGVHDRMRAYVMFDNFLNLLSDRWNVFRRRQFAGLQDVATVSGIDAQGRYIISSASGVPRYDTDNQPQFNSSLWRIKVGISYNF